MRVDHLLWGTSVGHAGRREVVVISSFAELSHEVCEGVKAGDSESAAPAEKGSDPISAKARLFRHKQL